MLIISIKNSIIKHKKTCKTKQSSKAIVKLRRKATMQIKSANIKTFIKPTLILPVVWTPSIPSLRGFYQAFLVVRFLHLHIAIQAPVMEEITRQWRKRNFYKVEPSVLPMNLHINKIKTQIVILHFVFFCPSMPTTIP